MKTRTNPRLHWEKVLKRAAPSKRLWLFDFDGTTWEDDWIQAMMLRFGSRASPDELVWNDYLRDYGHGKLTTRELIGFAYTDVLKNSGSVSALRGFARQVKLQIIPGIDQLLNLLHAHSVTPIGITSGTQQLVEVFLTRTRLTMPFVSHRYVRSLKKTGWEFEFLHDLDAGIDKGLLAAQALELGYHILGCAGDSMMESDMARETATHGGLVLARAGRSLAHHLHSNFLPGSWLPYEDFTSVLAAVEEHLTESDLLQAA